MTPQLAKLDRETTGLKLYTLMTLTGWILVGYGILVRLVTLAPTAMVYLGGNSKAVRDAAVVGSELLGQLTTLAWWPMLLLPLTFFGVAAFIVGIAMGFAAIPAILDRRTELLKQAVPLMGRNQ